SPSTIPRAGWAIASTWTGSPSWWQQTTKLARPATCRCWRHLREQTCWSTMPNICRMRSAPSRGGATAPGNKRSSWRERPVCERSSSPATTPLAPMTTSTTSSSEPENASPIPGQVHRESAIRPGDTVADPGLLSYVPRLVRDWATTPDERHRLIEGSLLFVDLTGFTAMTERLAALGRRGAEEVSAIISTTFEQMLTEAYRAGGSLLKFGGDALLLLFEDDTHRNDAAWSAWGIRRTLRTLGTFETPAGKVRLGLTSAIASCPIHVFVVGSDQKELLVAGDTVTELMRLERRAGTGQILMSESVAAALPASIHEPAAEGSRLLVRRPPPVPTRPTLAPSPGSSIDPFVPAAVRHRHATGETTLEHRHIAIGFVGIRGLDDRVRRDPAGAAEALEEVVERTISGAIQHGAWL